MDDFQKQSIFLRNKYPTFWTGLYHHRTHKNEPLDFIRAKYMLQIYQTDHPYKVIKSCSQTGKSEFLTVYAMTAANSGRGVFYILPTEKLAYRFVKNRIDLSIAYSNYYRSLVNKSGAESLTLKHIGKGVIAFVGAGSEASMVEFPADDYIVDELDRCTETEYLTMGLSRLDASKDPRILKVSNPSHTGFGIDEEYATTDQRKWQIKHECGKWITLDFFQNVLEKVGEDQYVIIDPEYDPASGNDIQIICHHCGKPVNRQSHGEWVAKLDSRRMGWEISKMFSSNKSIYEMVEMFNKGLNDPKTLQLFYNFDLGLAFDSPGAKITKADLDSCIASYRLTDRSPGPCVLGADVGKVFNVTIRQITPDGLRLVYLGQPEDPAEIVRLWKRYNVKAGIIDALPETRIVKKLQGTLPTLFRAYYGTPRHDMVNSHREIHMDRTDALDAVKEAFASGTVLNPLGSENVPDYYDQMIASTRVYDEDKNRYIWVEGSKADHYMHSEGYCIAAKKLLKFLR